MTLLVLPSGDTIELIDMLAKPGSWDEINRNVVRKNSRGDIVWRIGSQSLPSERSPYTNIFFEDDGVLRAYCWTGFSYRVDLESGAVCDSTFVK
jgi:hypothetical protein